MRSNIALTVALVGSLGALSARADETPINIQTDVKGQYFLVEKGGTAANPILLVKRSNPDYTSYVKRELDCTAHTVRVLGRGRSLEALEAEEPEHTASPIKPGSIADQLAKIACPR